MKRRARVAIVTNTIPPYRADFYRRILSSDQHDCHVFCQKEVPGADVGTAHHLFPGQVTIVDAISATNERVAWQILPYCEIRSDFDIWFVYGNPRVLSGVFLSCALRALGLPVVIWGQAHTAGASRVSERVRLAWWRTFSNLFVYTDDEVQYLRRRGFVRQRILGMNNGLDQALLDLAGQKWKEPRLYEWRIRQGLSRRVLLLSCARLVSRNQFHLMIEAMPRLLEAHPSLTWCIIGDGPDRSALERRAEQLGVNQSIVWKGAAYDEDELAPWFLSSLALVHPGAIGLTLLHAFGYGLPVVTHDDCSHQMPEFAALNAGKNGVLFRRGDVRSLVDAISAILTTPDTRSAMSQEALHAARKTYNTGVMARRFSEMVQAVWEAPGRNTDD